MVNGDRCPSTTGSLNPQRTGPPPTTNHPITIGPRNTTKGEGPMHAPRPQVA